MKVEFLGAARTVTGSKHLVHWRGQKILLDCGLFQGRRKEAFEINRNFPLDPREVDAVVLSHAHIDHSGNLPTLFRKGYNGPIYATRATHDLAVHLLMDSAHIQESDVKYVNKTRRKEGRELFEPLYVRNDALKAIQHIRQKDYHKFFRINDHVRCRFHDAGHMLGSALVELELERPDEQVTRLLFSGDVGRPEIPILRDPEFVNGVDFLIMEATYGGRLHPPGSDTEKILKQTLERVVREQGKLLIPAFSVGRTQQIVYALNLLSERGELPKIPVFVDSPLAVEATTVYRSHFDCFDEETQQQILSEDDRNPLGFENLHYVRRAEDSKALNRLKGPAVIISASGMCEAGRILHHLKNNIENPATTILFSGYQAPYTLGRRILDGEQQVRIFGKPHEVRAHVCRLEGTSGHADQQELVAWAQEIKNRGNIRQVALVHCEIDAATALESHLREIGLEHIMIPQQGESMSLEI
jgi:metallo-beta-lactamase family protein